MGCCGGKVNKPKFRKDRMAPRLGTARAVFMLPKVGMTLLIFLGRGSAVRPFYGKNGQRYLFGGRKHKTGYVLDSDVETMLSTQENGRPVFQRAKLAAAVKLPTKQSVAKIEQISAELAKDFVAAEPEPVPVKVKKPHRKKVVNA